MNIVFWKAFCLLLGAAVLSAPTLLRAATSEATVTRIVRKVELLPEKSKPEPAELNELVRQDTAVRTGDNSKSELTFRDLTITRLGANSIYTYNQGGRSVDLGGGSILLCVPKDSGGANVRSPAVTVAVTGTTLILETTRAGRNKLFLLEGSARLSLRKVSGQSRNVLAGQMLDVPAGATRLPMPTNFDINDLMKKHPLIVGFPPLPTRDRIADAAQNSPNAGEPVYQGQQVSGSGPGLGPIITGIGIPGITIGGGSGGGGRRPPAGHNPGRDNPPTRGNTQRPPPKATKQPTPPPGR